LGELFKDKGAPAEGDDAPDVRPVVLGRALAAPRRALRAPGAEGRAELGVNPCEF